MSAVKVISPAIFSSFPDLVAAQSTRLGGVSKGEYSELNLGSNTLDDANCIMVNKNRFCDFLGISYSGIVKSRQVHGDAILQADKPGNYEGFDALVTDRKNIFLAVSTADCVPILIFDPLKKVVAAVHAGWKGTALKLTFKTIQFMQIHYGSVSSELLVYIGACIDQCHFEVGNEVAVQFDDEFVSFAEDPSRKFVNLKSANLAQLEAGGVSRHNIEISAYCTYHDQHLFYSHRRDKGLTGRMWSVIGLR